MKFSTTSVFFFASSLFAFSSNTNCASALIDCNIVSKAAQDFNADRVVACDHFDGTAHEAYLNWYEKFSLSSKYPNQVYIQGADPDKPEDGAAIHWKVDDEYVYLAVAARATGWLAFGISEAGGMTGTDMVLFTAARPNELVDAYTDNERVPKTDDCASNWEMVSSHVDSEGGFLMFETKRLLNTDDPQDKPIVNDASMLMPVHRVIAAWGNSEEVGYHGLSRARGSIRFYGNGDEDSTFQAAMEKAAEGFIEIKAENYVVPAVDTTYVDFCFSRQDLIDQGLPNTTELLNVVGWEPVIQAGNEPYVHHYVVMGSNQPYCKNNITNGTDDEFNEMAYVWAPGEKGIAFPDFLGAPLFGDSGFQAFSLQIHYNNPTLDEGVVDNSGVKIYWTSEPREEQIGIMSIGDPLIGAFMEPIGKGFSKHEFECPSSCSSFFDQEVTVLREYLHMHEVGLRITNEQIRNNEVIRSGNIEFWEFHQNGNAAVQQDSFVVKPGDSFRTTCYYEDPDGSRVFGLASSQEMCMAFMYYYPRKVISMGEFDISWFCGHNLGFPECEASYEKTILENEDEIDRQYATSVSKDQCSASSDGTSDDENSSAFLKTSSLLRLAFVAGGLAGTLIL